MVTRYVNTASTAGGDGTTNATTGANRAYASMSEAETQMRTLNAADDVTVLCCGSAQDAVAHVYWNFSSYTYLQSGYTFTVEANENESTGFHGGRWNSGTYRLYTTDSAISFSIYLSHNNPVVIRGIQIDLHNGASDSIMALNSDNSIDVVNCLFQNTGTSNYDGIQHSGTGTHTVSNCALVDNASGIRGARFIGNGTYKYYNCAVIGWGSGFYESGSGTYVVKNCAVFDNTDDFNGSFTTIDHCASDDGDGTNSLTGLTWANEFTHPTYATTVDFHPRNGSKLLTSGIGRLSDADVPSTDIVGFERLWRTPAIGPFGNGYEASKVTRYVNTASTAGGDGTTNATTGVNRAFPSLGNAETSLRGSAFADDLEILCCGSVADAITADFDENTYNYVQAGYTIAIRANRSDPAGYHGGKWNNSTYRLVNASSAYTRFYCYRNIIIDGIQLWNQNSGWDGLNLAGFMSNGNALIKDCIFRAQNAVGSSDVQINNNSGTFSYRFDNCVFAGQNSTQKSWDGIEMVGTQYSVKVYNCVFSTNITGIANLNNSVVKNCSFQNVDTLYTSGASSTFDHNATTSGTGTNPITISSWDAQFKSPNYATDLDFRLKKTSVLIAAGIGPVADSDVPTGSIGSAVRHGQLADVGPFQYSFFRQSAGSIGVSSQSGL